MALLFMDSFDHYATADLLEKWSASAVTGSTVAIGATGRRGSGGWRWTTGTSQFGFGSVQRALVPGDATCILGFALNVGAGLPPTTGPIIASLRDANGIAQVALRLNTDNTLAVVRGHSSNTLLGTSSQGLSVGVYAYIEWRTTIADAGGTTDVWLNGVNVLSLTGLDTRNGLATWASVVLGQWENVSGGLNSTSRTLDYDDVYVLDGTGPAPWNAPLGDVRVDARFPTGAGATTGWTPSAGANWAAVDDAAPNDDTDYVNAATVLTDTYVVQDAPVVGAAILGVQVNLAIKKMDAGTCTVSPVVRHSGVDQVGPAQAPGTAYAFLRGVYPTNPGTSAAWVEADFNAAEFGIQKVT